MFPQTDAGDPGRIAITYLGSENAEMLNESDIDKPLEWKRTLRTQQCTYHLYITYSLNALMRTQSSTPIRVTTILFRLVQYASTLAIERHWRLKS